MATSYTQAEHHSLSEATKEAMHLETNLETSGRPASATLMALVKRDDGSPQAKHFATRLAFVRDILQDERRGIKLDFVATADNRADVFKKGLVKTKMQQHLQRL